MSKNDNLNQEQLYKKITNLHNEEKELRRQKYLLQKQQPWYQQPSNVIGILAIIITIIFSVYSIFNGSEKLELTCIYSDPKPLTNFSPALQEKIAVTFENIPTSNIGKIYFKLINTGNRGLKKDDFVDGPIDFIIQSKSKFNNIDSIKTVPFLLDIKIINNSKQKNDILKLDSKDKNGHFSYLPSLINKNDIVEFEVYISDINNVKISIQGNIANGKIISQKFEGKKDKNNFLKVGDILIDLFGSKWAAILILLVVFLLSLLKSLLAMADNFERNLLDITFGTLFIAIDGLFIMLIISIMLN